MAESFPCLCWIGVPRFQNVTDFLKLVHLIVSGDS